MSEIRDRPEPRSQPIRADESVSQQMHRFCERGARDADLHRTALPLDQKVAAAVCCNENPAQARNPGKIQACRAGDRTRWKRKEVDDLGT